MSNLNIIQKPSYKKRIRKLKPKGLLLHTSGRTISQRAEEWGVPTIQLALEHYRKVGAVHGVIDYDGTFYQTLPFDRRGPHVGISAAERRVFLDGTWETAVIDREPVDPRTLQLWHLKYPQHASPSHLYSTKSPNDSYIGVELVPLVTPRSDGSWYTAEQYATCKALYAMLAASHNWDIQDPTTLLGHEDVDPFGRWFTVSRYKKAIKAWDPGGLRDVPRFFWSEVPRTLPEDPTFALDIPKSRIFDLLAIIREFFGIPSGNG